MKKHVPDASLYSHVGTEVAIRLPSQARGSFAAMLRDLEANREELCINAYGLSVTTLEEVIWTAATAVRRHGRPL